MSFDCLFGVVVVGVFCVLIMVLVYFITSIMVCDKLFRL